MQVLEMKTVHCVVCAFFFFCVLDITKGSEREFTDVWRNLPHDFGNVINNAWNSIIKAIKSPVIERKRGRRRKKAPTTSTTMESYEILSTYYFPTDIPRRPTIPIITQPTWRSLLDWRILQKPNLVKLAQEFRNKGASSMYGREKNSYEGTTAKLTTNDEDSHFERYKMSIEDNEGSSKKINIPVLPTPKYRYDYLWRPKYTNQFVIERYKTNIEDNEGRSKKINIPVLPKPKYRYDYLWRPKYTNQFVIVPYSTKNPASREITAEETFNHFHSTQLETTTEETGSLLKEWKFVKYRLKILYKLLFA